MKIRRLLIFALIGLLLSLSGCRDAVWETDAAYIGIDAAKNAALSAAGVSSEEAAFSTAGLDNRNGTFYYQICFTAGGTEYEYAVDALTGIIIESSAGGSAQENNLAEESSTAAPSTAPAETAGDNSSGIFDGAEALRIALAHAGIAETEAQDVEVKRDYEHDAAVYKIEFRTAAREKYEYKIDASTGAVISYDYEQDGHEQPSAAPSAAMLSEEEIREIIQKRVPGAPAENIFLHLDEDDGRMEYEGTLLYDSMEYEFTIDAYSGSVIEWEAKQTG